MGILLAFLAKDDCFLVIHKHTQTHIHLSDWNVHLYSLRTKILSGSLVKVQENSQFSFPGS